MANLRIRYGPIIHKCRFGLFICLLLFTAERSNAQGKAIASIKPARVETGDTIVLYVMVSGINVKPKSVDFASWLDFFPTANILSRSEWRKSGDQWVQQFKLIAFDSAKLELPPLTVLLAAGNPLTTNALMLNVFPTPGDDISDMAPMRDIYREPVSWMDYWPWGAGGLALLGIFFWYVRKKNRRPPVAIIQPVAVAPPLISAREIALTKLDALQQAQLWKKDQIKEHYATLSLIVREYLEGNYGIAALESTTIEIMPLLASSNFPATQKTSLREILNQADMVKYAQSQPKETAHEDILDKTRKLVIPDYLPQPQNPIPTKKPPHKPKSGKYEPL